MESAGWGVFGGLSALLAGPCVWLVWNLTYDTATVGLRIASGVLMAVIAAAFLTAGLNEVLHRLNAGSDEAKVSEVIPKKGKSGKRKR